ncbi:hypothetical protein [Cellulomonas dongxiuzhuiae]|uniref:Uncharacterized protein n=1 Tax=Cellulomonas dongxiuzhuiae TaxID=2819979 RepID=A0ABX8GG12_9CELL|nr:hypothetical protein [Cellulomonas dongxiuzhuiae]MBO3093993.1 hypothetical protein [Cellulomonas dongxiuzhuiae]QWC15068.1 hypothetical protein KKR89_12095 [Cellulomonas dongxiuzhuiae]
MNATPARTPARHRRVIAVGAVAAGLSVACAGGAMAVAPGSAVSRTLSGALQSVGIEWQGMPEGYTPEQYTAFWDAGYTWGDAQHLSELWQLDIIETKSQAGRLLADGQTLPITPGTYPEAGADPQSVALDAFWSVGYTYEDAEQLAALWGVDVSETKARAGQALVDGQTLPVEPSGTATTGS